MIPEIGHFALILALLVALIQSVFPLIGAARGQTYTRFNANALMRGDSVARANYYRLMLTAGVMSVNEVRALEEMESIGDEGDEHLVQINLTTLERMVAGDVSTAGAPGSVPVASPAEPDSDEDPDGLPDPGTEEDEPTPGTSTTNVIRRAALAWQRRQA